MLYETTRFVIIYRSHVKISDVYTLITKNKTQRSIDWNQQDIWIRKRWRKSKGYSDIGQQQGSKLR